MSNSMRYFDSAKIIHFKERFEEFEEQALAGELEYDDFPPEEYRYFSKLSRLGYHMRYGSGHDQRINEIHQRYYKEYQDAVEDREERLRHYQDVTKRRIRTREESYRLNGARTPEDALDASLELVELLLEEHGLKVRIKNNISANGIGAD